jgi:hypothetical protein
VRCWSLVFSDNVFDCADEAASLVTLFENLPYQVTRGCLAVCSCHAYALQCSVGVFKKCGGDVGHRSACIWDDNNWAGGIWIRFLGYRCYSASFDSLLNECIAIGVGSGECKEKRAGFGLA